MAESPPVFIDTSCLVALEMREPGAQALRRRIEQAPTRYAAALAEAELMAAMAREGRPRVTVSVPGVGWVSPSRRLTRELQLVLSVGYVRGADAWHVACALYLDATARELTFLTLDTRQREVAAAVGFTTS